MAKEDFSGYVLIVSSSDSEGPVFLNNGQLKDLCDDPQGSYGVQTWLDGVPPDADPNVWGEGTALLMRVRFATLEAVETITRYEVQLVNE